MNPRSERRAGSREYEDALTPEFLVLLARCGGQIRESDRAALANIQRREVPERRSQDRRRQERRVQSPRLSPNGPNVRGPREDDTP